MLGLLLCLGSLLAPALAAALRVPRGSPWEPSALPLLMAAIPSLAVLDATMNSFIFFPAITVAGALAAALRRQREEINHIKKWPTSLEPCPSSDNLRQMAV